jgi:excisionase family DNA binding protein
MSVTTTTAAPPPRTPAPSTRRLLTLLEVCDRLGLNRKTVRRLMREDGLRWTRIGRDIRFRPEWVEEYIDRQASPAAAPPRPARRRAR